MADEQLRKLVEEQELVREAITDIKQKLEQNEQRRQCLWGLTIIHRKIEAVSRSVGPQYRLEQAFESLEAYANITFDSTKDLKTLQVCLALIVETMDDAATVAESYSKLPDQIQPLLEDLMTLHTGNPPATSAADELMRHFRPEIQDAERESVRSRFQERLRSRMSSR